MEIYYGLTHMFAGKRSRLLTGKTLLEDWVLLASLAWAVKIIVGELLLKGTFSHKFLLQKIQYISRWVSMQKYMIFMFFTQTRNIEMTNEISAVNQIRKKWFHFQWFIYYSRFHLSARAEMDTKNMNTREEDASQKGGKWLKDKNKISLKKNSENILSPEYQISRTYLEYQY